MIKGSLVGDKDTIVRRDHPKDNVLQARPHTARCLSPAVSSQAKRKTKSLHGKEHWEYKREQDMKTLGKSEKSLVGMVSAVGLGQGSL